VRQSPATGRRIFANLDCEADFAAMDGRPRIVLSRAALDHAAALATLLRAFAAAGDRLWTPAPVAAERLAEVPGLPCPLLESGPPAALPATGSLLAWGETATAAALRRAGSVGVPPASSPHEPLPRSRRDAGVPSEELFWTLPTADPAVAAAVHHRGFALDVATRLGCALPGAAMLTSAAELECHLRALAAGAWVVKAPFSAAGRSRHVVRGEPTSADRRRIERLFARHRELLFEPWLDRSDDFGVAGAIAADGVHRIGFHRSFTAPRGAFLGVELRAAFAGVHDLDRRERQRLDEVFAGVARALLGAGYRGPFGIDCWRYRLPSGEPAFHPLGEINARMTLGMVARALVDRVREPLGLDPRATVRLLWGPGDPPSGAVPVLHRGDSPRSLAAWLCPYESPLGPPVSKGGKVSE
jgi:hypothetical protein